jgi:hypothetical protein
MKKACEYRYSGYIVRKYSAEYQRGKAKSDTKCFPSEVK